VLRLTLLWSWEEPRRVMRVVAPFKWEVQALRDTEGC
jgi:hypothetical protein